MRQKSTKVMSFIVLLGVLTLAMAAMVYAGDGGEYQSPFYGTAWALLPPVIAIVLAFFTREANSALFIGTMVGAILYANFNPLMTIEHFVTLTAEELGGNGGILIFLVALGIIVAMMERSGCSAAYGRWAITKVKTKTQALLSTTVLGLFFSIDDYFNCLTNGNVMRPVTDKHKISRARLAYNIDCTAAPICIIAPVSSWGAAVASYIPDEYALDGFALFIQTIPFNFYALLTLTMLFALAFMKFDFGPMTKYEKMAEEDGDIYGGTGNLYEDTSKKADDGRGKVIDMFVPVAVLIIGSIGGLMYTGGFFDGGVSVIESFSNCDAFVGLPIGGIIAMLVTIPWYLVRKSITPKEFVDCIPDGFHMMVPAMLILILSWGISTVCRASLGATPFIDGVMTNSNFPMMLLPVILYMAGTLISFTTGTSWGTFGILIPIVLAIFGGVATPLCVISLAAALSGAVTGDHCSPISETAIMSSSAAQVDFMMHVTTQIPYAVFIAVLSSIGFLIAGFMQSALLALPLMLVVLIGLLFVIRNAGTKSGFARVRKID